MRLYSEERNVLALVGVGAVLIIGSLIFFAVRENAKQVRLIDGGTCDQVTEALYHPPPSYVCTMRNADGGCTMQTPIYKSPYMRTLWRCDGEKDFWRRSEP